MLKTTSNFRSFASIRVKAIRIFITHLVLFTFCLCIEHWLLRVILYKLHGCTKVWNTKFWKYKLVVVVVALIFRERKKRKKNTRELYCGNKIGNSFEKYAKINMSMQYNGKNFAERNNNGTNCTTHTNEAYFLCVCGFKQTQTQIHTFTLWIC